MTINTDGYGFPDDMTFVEILTSTDLRSCSLAARGLWLEVFGLMSNGSQFGYVLLSTCKANLALTAAFIARKYNASEKEVIAHLNELKDAGAISLAADGAVYSPKMVREGDPLNPLLPRDQAQKQNCRSSHRSKHGWTVHSSKPSPQS
jgi:hypothetical protein